MADEKTISHDFRTHRDSWRDAIQRNIDLNMKISLNSEDNEMWKHNQEYWQHELEAFDRAFDSLLNSGFKEV